ncbi:MAG: hypothetical protein ACPGRD_00210 [Planktomarina sp.]
MTALKNFERLECVGLWRPDASTQRREVIVSFGNSTLVLSDMQSRVLAHWSLAAIQVTPISDNTLELRPERAGAETLEIDDPVMIDAIKMVQKAIKKNRPHPGRLRLILGGVALLITTMAGLFWVPNALISYAANVLPDVKRVQLGHSMLAHLDQTDGPICTGPYGAEAAEQIARRIDASGSLEIAILPGTGAAPIVLPGSLVVLFENMVVGTDDPAVTAGHILAAQIRALRQDTLKTLLTQAGPRIAISLISSNTLTPQQVGTLVDAAQHPRAQEINAATLVTAFEIAEISASPYADHLPANGLSSVLKDNDPYPAGTPQPILPDGAWLGLQSICSDL